MHHAYFHLALLVSQKFAKFAQMFEIFEVTLKKRGTTIFVLDEKLSAKKVGIYSLVEAIHKEKDWAELRSGKCTHYRVSLYIQPADFADRPIHLLRSEDQDEIRRSLKIGPFSKYLRLRGQYSGILAVEGSLSIPEFEFQVLPFLDFVHATPCVVGSAPSDRIRYS